MADTNIKYSDHSISSAFKDHYIVPDYQREYVWTNDQVEQLLSDLLEAFEEDNKKPYFLGTIVTCDTGSQFELIADNIFSYALCSQASVQNRWRINGFD